MFGSEQLPEPLTLALLLALALVTFGRKLLNFFQGLIHPNRLTLFESQGKEQGPNMEQIRASLKKIEGDVEEIKARTFDPSEVARHRRFFEGSEHRPSGLHEIRSQMASLTLSKDLAERRLDTLETTVGTMLRQNADLLKENHGMMETMTEMLRRWPSPGTRGTPPSGEPIVGEG